MGMQVYISADYSEYNGDRNVVEILHKWSDDNLHVVDYVDTAEVVSGSVSDDPDCRVCDLKEEFNRQINASSAIIFIVGDKTASRVAGSTCKRHGLSKEFYCDCTPYKKNANGLVPCKLNGHTLIHPGANDDVGKVNRYSFIEHEFRQAVKKKKTIIVVYNSVKKQPGWLPSYMSDYVDIAQPFWIKGSNGEKIGNYYFIKQALGY